MHSCVAKDGTKGKAIHRGSETCGEDAKNEGWDWGPLRECNGGVAVVQRSLGGCNGPVWECIFFTRGVGPIRNEQRTPQE